MSAFPEANRVEAVPIEVHAEAAPAPVEIRRPDKITDIAQLPSVWTLPADIEWLIEDMIPLGSITLLTGESGGGKTWLAYAIAGAVALGEPFAGHAVKQKPVLYLDGENPLCLVKQRLFDLGVAEIPDLRVWGGWVVDPPPGPDSTLIVEYVRQHQPLLIWDSLIDFHDGEEQSATETRAFMKVFRGLANAGATVVILHHTGKTATSQEYRGSSDIKAAVDMAYCLETEFTLDRRIHKLTMRNFKGRFAPGRDLGLEFVQGKGFIRCDVPVRATGRDPMHAITEIIAANPGSNQSQIVALAQADGISKHLAETCLKEGAFHTERGTGKELRYTLAKQARTPEIPVPKEREYGNSTVPMR